MRYIIAIFLPPLAVFLCGKPFQGIISIFLTLLFWRFAITWSPVPTVSSFRNCLSDRCRAVVGVGPVVCRRALDRGALH